MTSGHCCFVDEMRWDERRNTGPDHLSGLVSSTLFVALKIFVQVP
jgi:hypothetical protein